MAERQRPVTCAKWKAQHRWTAASMDEQVRFPILAAALFVNVDHGNDWGQGCCDVSHRRCFVSTLG